MRIPLLVLLVAGFSAQLTGQSVDRSMLNGLTFRAIGPAIMGGRVTDVAGVPGDPSTFYFAHASGGLFKTSNAGTTFEPIFDDVGVPSIGAIAIAPSDPNVIYVGTGEGNPRNSASVGRGMFRSVDAGRTWRPLGLEATERFTRIRVHPNDPDIVYAAALGHEWGANEERGVYRSGDGGATWEKILYVDENTGAADLAMDPANPRILYAAMYDFRRRPWHFRSGGPGSGLYRTADGGDTWVELTGDAPTNGLPEGPWGRIGVAPAPSDANVVYAIIETAAEGEVWRSDDRGDTWHMVTAQSDVNSRPFYFTDLRVDPTTSERVYALSGRLMVSDDGGRTWRQLGQDIHPDHHALWIDPDDPDRIIDGNDGGVFVTYDRGRNFEYLNRVPLGQFYQIGADMRDPYYVCGGLQDNGIWCGPSKNRQTVGLINDNWEIIHFGDGYYAQIDPRDWTTIYTNAHYGNIVRVDASTFEKQSIQPYPVSLQGSAAGDHPFRFNWNSPIHMSPTDPNTVYFGSNVLFRTRDGGRSWDQISPDLTTNDPAKQRPSGGEITVDNTSAEYHTTIYTIAESPADPAIVWVGTDDGLVQVTSDGGTTWTNVTGNVPRLPEASWVTRIEASHFDANVAYATFDRHRLDDMRPYVFVTGDRGQTWRNLTANLPAFGYLKVIREDPRNPDVLYLGSEFGLWASFDRGARWISLNGSLPPVPVNDILAHPRDNDLIVATHGRSVWILDDLAPLQHLTDAVADGVFLFEPPVATRFQMHFTKPFLAQGVFKGENPGSVAMISYYLGEASDDVAVTIEDGEGTVVRTLEGPGTAGINRVTWELDYDEAGPNEGGPFARSNPLLRVLPGDYTVHLRAGDEERTTSLRVRLDPALGVDDAEVVAQIEAVRHLTEMRALADETIDDLIGVEDQIDPVVDRLESVGDRATDVAQAARGAAARLDSLRLELVSDPGGYRSPAMLRDRIAALLEAIGSYTGAPTTQQRDWIGKFDVQLTEAVEAVRVVIDEEIAEINRRIQDLGLPMITVPPRPSRLVSEEVPGSM